VQGHTRRWDVKELEAILPRGIFKNVTTLTVDHAKIDEYVRAKKIDREAIADAFIETPNKPYVKWTPKKADQSERAEAEADSLAGKLG
jgi:hypothetical protein